MAVIALVAGLPAARRREALARAAARLAPRAPAGSAQHDDGAWSAWWGVLDPGEAMRRAPLALAGRHALLFDGWLRNAQDIARHLGLPADHAPAALVLDLLRREGVEGLSRLRGFHALAWIAPDAVWLVRDASGQRPLAWRLADDVLHVASSELAVLDAAEIGAEPMPPAVAAFCAGQAPPPGMTFLRGVEEVPPGCVVRLDARGASTRAAGWRPSPRGVPRDVPGAWREALHGAVQDALAAGAQAAISLSGGLDSSTLAAFAGDAPRRPIAASWRLPGEPVADESHWIDAVATALNLPQVGVDGSALAPLAEGVAQPLQLESPLANPYRALKQALWRAVRDAGADVLLSGNYGDHLYPGEREWLRAAWRAGRRGAALVELARRARRGAPWRDPGVRAALRPLLRAADGAADAPPAWLGPAALAAWRAPAEWPPAASSTADPLRCRALLGLEAGLDAAHETGFADRAGLRILHPFRDERVVELALSIPAERFARGGVPKALTREVLAGRLPETVRLRPKSGSLVPFLHRGLRATPGPMGRLLDAPGARWSHWLDEARVRAAATTVTPTEDDDWLLWRAASLEMWFRGLAQGAPVLAFGP